MTGRSLKRGLSTLLAVAIVSTHTQALFGQTQGSLEPGTVVAGSMGLEGHALYAFEAGAAGVLTIVVRSLDGTDLFLLVADSDGQPLPAGRSDQDLGGDAGAEQFAVTLPRAGEYQIRVESFGGGQGAFKIGASWLPFPELAVPEDPDGSPSTAVRIRVGQDTRDDSVDGSAGDYWDWFVLKADEAGTLTVATRGEEGDLILEAFQSGAFSEAVERSDQDLQGIGGNEALTLAVKAGEEFYFKVSAFSESGSFGYRLQVGFIPN